MNPRAAVPGQAGGRAAEAPGQHQRAEEGAAGAQQQAGPPGETPVQRLPREHPREESCKCEREGHRDELRLFLRAAI